MMIAPLIVAGPWLIGHAIYNVAMVSLIHGRSDYHLFELALERVPNDTHIRWQTGVVQAAVGDYHKAADILQPLLRADLLTSDMLQQFINILTVDGQIEEVYRIYSHGGEQRAISPGSAAAILRRFDKDHSSLLAADWYNLHARLFGLDPTRDDVASALDFVSKPVQAWPPHFGEEVIDAVRWRSLENDEGEVTGSPAANAEGCKADDALDALELHGSIDGGNLVVNGDFEEYDPIQDRPKNWTPVYASEGDTWGIGAFVVGIDEHVAYSGSHSMRLDGLFVKPIEGRDSPRAGYQGGPIDLDTNSHYIVCLMYRDNNMEETIASLQIAEGGYTSLQGDYFLPPTAGRWKRINLLFSTGSIGKTPSTPLLRIWKTGSIWIDDIELHKVVLQNPAQVSSLKVNIQDVGPPAFVPVEE